ncbi:hypothetical protein [Kitasatospora sp. NPDC057223]|uniref:hypothetical protein n=1 Tax=Kitasatospora sp. NPDC057223 TaxID=3346055 RepID=UPI00364434DD
MHQYRIVKYSPAEREGTEPAWTSISDIGSTFDSRMLSEQEYLETEAKYLAALAEFIRLAGVASLRVDGLEIYDDSPWWGALEEGEELSGDRAVELARSVLREDSVWCRLAHDDFFVHFGYDYYMYVGISDPADSAVGNARRAGLYVDEFESPYLDDA